MAATKSTGRETRRYSATAQARTPDLNRYYRNNLPPIHPGEYEFDLTLLRPQLPALSLNPMVEILSWVDEQAILSGSITAKRPDPESPPTLPVERGHLVRCRVRWGDTTFGLWTMRASSPQIQVDTGDLTVALQDDMALLDAGGQDWIFRTTKHRTFGYFADDIAHTVARRLGVGIGALAKGTVRQTLIKRNATGLDVIRAAYQHEKDKTGRSFIVRLRNAKLEVVPLARNPQLYVLEHEIQTALITQKAGSKVPTTVLEGRGHIGKGKDAKKISFTAYDRAIVSRFGYVKNTRDYGHVTSHAELRAAVKRDLAQGLRLNDTVTISHQGIPFIARGDGAQIKLPAEGYTGDQSFVFATRADHTVQAGVYTSSWDFTLSDPFLALLAADKKAAAARAKKREQRKRPKVAAAVKHA